MALINKLNKVHPYTFKRAASEANFGAAFWCDENSVNVNPGKA